MDIVKNRFWIWGQEGHHKDYKGIPGTSRMTPAEGALYLGIPNVLIVRYFDWPPLPYHQLALSLRPFRQVVWSIAGAGGLTIKNQESDLEQVLDLARRFPNVRGAIMDDVFRTPTAENPRISKWSAEQVRQFHERLQAASPPLPLWSVLYLDRDLDKPVKEYLAEFDVITLWTWWSKNLDALENNVGCVERLAPGKRLVLGCYMYDYGADQPMSVAAMERQCQTGLEWLKTGRIHGMIFLTSCLCDLDLESVEWTRTWIKQVGETPCTI